MQANDPDCVKCDFAHVHGLNGCDDHKPLEPGDTGTIDGGSLPWRITACDPDLLRVAAPGYGVMLVHPSRFKRGSHA